MNELTALALELQTFCEARQWRFCLIGGLAVQHWGEPRFTRDVDMTLLTGFGNEEPYVHEWLANYESRVVSPLEFALGGLPFEEDAVERAKLVEMELGTWLRLCTAEDLIIMKAFANRPQDRLDLRGILVRQGPATLDWKRIWEELTPLAEIKGTPDILDHLEGLVKAIGR